MMHEHPELRLFLADRIPEARREEVLRHLRGCSACRAGVAAEDPARLFALLALEPVPRGLLDRLSEDVAAAIEDPAATPARGPFRGRWVSIAASLLLAGVFGAYLLNRDGRVTEPVETPVVSHLEEQKAEQAFELISSRESVEWIDLSVGGERVVMIFDEELDL